MKAVEIAELTITIPFETHLDISHKIKTEKDNMQDYKATVTCFEVVSRDRDNKERLQRQVHRQVCQAQEVHRKHLIHQHLHRMQ